MPNTKNSQFRSFAASFSSKAKKIIDRAICFIWYHNELTEKPSTLQNILDDFELGGLARPNQTVLRKNLTKDRRTAKKGENAWIIKSDKLREVDEQFGLTSSAKAARSSNSIPLKNQSHEYVNLGRLQSIKNITSSSLDFTRLIEMLEEINACFTAQQFIAVICLLRAILDHVPPAFGCVSFSEVSNNYSGGRSFKESMKRLEGSSRKIADSYLHTQIRSSESLPSQTQVDFSNDLDVLLAEIVRKIRSTS